MAYSSIGRAIERLNDRFPVQARIFQLNHSQCRGSGKVWRGIAQGYRVGVGGNMAETTVEFIFYLISGIVYSLMIIFTIEIYLCITYMLFKFAFWVFDRLDIENPVIVVYERFKEVFQWGK